MHMSTINKGYNMQLMFFANMIFRSQCNPLIMHIARLG